MVINPATETKNTESVEYWKARYERQKFLIGSMASLLNRYGSSIEPEQLYSVFLLTLMGQFVVGDACYYRYKPETASLDPELVYGRVNCGDLPLLTVGSRWVDELRANPMPKPISEWTPNTVEVEGMDFLTGRYRLSAPLFLKEKLVGVAFLGNRVTGQSFSTSDLEVLTALCAVSATTFNNANLYENAKHSAREIRRLYDVRNEVINRITHEFRTPLTILKAGVELLASDTANTELVGLFAESENRLEDLINSLLSLSQQGSRDDIPNVRTDPLSLLHDSIRRHAEAASEKKIQFNVVQKAAVASPDLHIGDNDIRTILDALLENAIKFSPSGNSVSVGIDRSTNGPTVDRDGLQLPDWHQQTEDLMREYQADSPRLQPARAPREQTKQRNAMEYLVVRISDSGIGIPEQDVLSVAEPFRQASNSPDLGVKGKGLGLALVHKIVTRYGGYLCCKSSEGSGATFTVFLPVQTAFGL
jgi:signal transduction histidine kinase